MAQIKNSRQHYAYITTQFMEAEGITVQAIGYYCTSVWMLYVVYFLKNQWTIINEVYILYCI